MRNIDDGQLYAVKLIKIKKAGVPIESLRQEASRLAKLNHPNIVRYYTSFKKKPFFAIVTELLTGGSLLERIDGAAGPLPAGQIKRWTIQIASALAHMHAQRMQHRDLKPDNVLFDALGDARLIDLGLAQIVVAKSKVSSKNAVGAELYRSPEKALGSAYDAKDDIWALGCMVAGAATGKSLEDRSASGAGLFALSRDKVKSLVDEAASSTFGELVAATLQIKPIKRPAAEIIELALRSGKSLAAAARDGTIFEEEDDDATSDALNDVPYAEVVGVAPSNDAPSEDGLADSLGKEPASVHVGVTCDDCRGESPDYVERRRRVHESYFVERREGESVKEWMIREELEFLKKRLANTLSASEKFKIRKRFQEIFDQL
jgi:serine/threonine protein kinase